MPSMQSQSGYRSSHHLSPASLTGVVIVHLGLGAAIVSMTAFTFVPKPVDIIWTHNIRAEQPKPDKVEPKPITGPKIAHVTRTEPTVVTPQVKEPDFTHLDIPTQPFTATGGSDGDLPFGNATRPLDPPPTPILVQAKPDPRFAGAFQPPYPAGMLRLQVEGNVTVKVMIGPDGRVIDIQLVDAVDPAFFEATRRQALGHWRFVPATRDGVPVASERVMTVRFRLTD